MISGMALGLKLSEEVGKITSFKLTKVHPLEGVTTEVSSTSDIKGIGRSAAIPFRYSLTLKIKSAVS